VEMKWEYLGRRLDLGTTWERTRDRNCLHCRDQLQYLGSWEYVSAFILIL
jgi:hypothetical protein